MLKKLVHGTHCNLVRGLGDPLTIIINLINHYKFMIWCSSKAHHGAHLHGHVQNICIVCLIEVPLASWCSAEAHHDIVRPHTHINMYCLPDRIPSTKLVFCRSPSSYTCIVVLVIDMHTFVIHVHRCPRPCAKLLHPRIWSPLRRCREHCCVCMYVCMHT